MKGTKKLIFSHLLGIFAVTVGCTSQETTKTLPPSPSPSPVILPSPSKDDSQAAAELRAKGLQYRKENRFPEAIEALKASVKRDPTHLSGRIILGWTLHLDGQAEAAIAELQPITIQDPNNVEALNALGIVYLVKGDLEKAIETHQKAIQLKPNNEIAHYNLSLAYHRTGDYQTAIKHGKMATQLEPYNPHPWVALSLIYWDNQEKVLAKETYQKAISLDARYRQKGYLDHLKEAGFSQEQIDTIFKFFSY
jgi:tetratricopeptide (TPR) repeat protein